MEAASPEAQKYPDKKKNRNNTRVFYSFVSQHVTADSVVLDLGAGRGIRSTCPIRRGPMPTRAL